MDWIIEARCFVSGDLVDCCVGIDEATGTITDVRRVLTGAPVRRYPGMIAVPAAVDLHVHFRDPGDTKKEDFATGTLAAVLGGVGTILDMPNTDPLVDTTTRLEEKDAEVRHKARVDYGLWATLSHRTRDPEALAAAAAGLKLYLAPTTSVETGADADAVDRVLATARRAKRLVGVHAESPTAPDAATLQQHDASRPVDREAQAIAFVGQRRNAQDAIHICHSSSTRAVEAASDAGFSYGLTPHHLRLAIDRRWALTGKVNPPLRAPEVREGLWAHFRDGAPAILETDHAPHRWEEKDQPFSETPAGLPGVQTTYPLMLNLARRGDVTLSQVVAAYAQRPAERIGVPKGFIKSGYAADIVLVDPRRPSRIRRDWIASKCGWSPYEGLDALIPQTVVLAGETVVEDGHAHARKGRGRRLTPEAPGPVPTRVPAPSGR